MQKPSWITYLFNVANLVSSEEHRKLYSYPAMTGEYYISSTTTEGCLFYDIVSKKEAKAIKKSRGSNASIREFGSNPMSSQPDWREYTNFIKNLRNDQNASGGHRIELADNFINKFFNTKYNFRQIPVVGNEQLPMILRGITGDIIRARFMSNYQTYHFYLSDPELFKHIRTPMQVLRTSTGPSYLFTLDLFVFI